MRIDILTIFPNAFSSYLSESILRRAQKKKIFRIAIHDIRKFSKDKHRKVDDTPYGGGPGMVMTPQPLFDAIRFAKKKNKGPVIYLTPQGNLFTNRMAKKLAKLSGFILLCGRYEGIDDRIRRLCVDQEISIGEYVLTGGELPAMVLIDAVTRFLPGVLGNVASAQEESFSEAFGGKREYPQYTKPRIFQGLKVPSLLLTGDHHRIAEWRRKHLK